MSVTIDIRVLRRSVVALVVAAGMWVGVGAAVGAVSSDPLPKVAFLARADNPVDALAAAGVAGQLGAPVYLTFPDVLGTDARNALIAY